MQNQLVSAITEAEFGKRSHSRNPLIFGLFAKMHLVEQVGSGVVRMKELMKVAGLKAPVFQKEGFFTITLLRPLNLEKPSQKSSLKPSLKTKDNILLLINQNSKITILELSQLLHKSRRAIELQIKSLKENKLIEVVGLDMIVLDNTKKLVPDTGGLVSDTFAFMPDTAELVPDTSFEDNNSNLSGNIIISQEHSVLNYLKKYQSLTVKVVEELLEVKGRRARAILSEMTQKGLIEKQGKARSTIYKKKN